MVNYFNIRYNKRDNNFYIEFETKKEYNSFIIMLNNEIIITSNSIFNDNNIISKSSNFFCYNLGKVFPDLKNQYLLKVIIDNEEFTKKSDISELYDEKVFNDRFYYNGELGALYSKDKTIFRVWSPVSRKMKLRIYKTGTPKKLGGSDICEEYEMIEQEFGVWEYVINGDIEGHYYTFIVSNYEYNEKEVVDPYAKSTGINGLRGMIVDFSKTNPKGFSEIKINKIERNKIVVYETHIADLTSSSTWNGPLELSKQYLGFCEENTKYRGFATGFDHIKELGVNFVQILPFFSSFNDERINNRVFNWGYNPLNYNSLNGIFSKNPYDGYEKIKEFKSLVYKYLSNGINIIMDVVYNHVNEYIESNFDCLMPKYYFRYVNDLPSNGSACGNETASERLMFKKFMIDSTEFWAKEYKLGGFRFDLMGVHNVESMNDISSNLKKKVDPNLVIYGEPWYANSIALNKSFLPAVQENMNLFAGYGCFNDKIRDALIRGGLNDKKEKGYVTNSSYVSTADVMQIESSLRGLIISDNPILESEKCINYVTCHDNFTLHDRIIACGIYDVNILKKMAMLSNAIILISQGISFILSGEEILRDKNGSDNSYNLSYKINEIDYSKKENNSLFLRNYKKLIYLKTKTSLFSKSNDECRSMDIKYNQEMNYFIINLKDDNKIDYRIAFTNGYSTKLKYVDFKGYKLYLDILGENPILNENTILNDYQMIIAFKEN